jgi:hypothetical protein
MTTRTRAAVLGYVIVAGGLLSLTVGSVGAAVRIAIDDSKDVRPISPYIYGVNGSDKRPLARVGGNRLTAYNWENNASNAGSDWHHQSDGLMSASDEAGAGVLKAIQTAGKNKQALVMTVPINGFVAADKGPEGDVNQTPDYLHKRFKEERAKKDGPLSLKPDVNDPYVYQDEFVNWVEAQAKANGGVTVFYAMDNEPDLWSETHKRIHPEKVTYAELARKTIDYASAIKGVRPDALVFGAVNYGWHGFRTLQDAPDASGRDFHAFFLGAMKDAEAKAGRRLVDVLDVHWYPEAQGGGVRVIGKETTPEVVEARVQAPRSLWDPGYIEKSWIAEKSTHGPIALLPRMRKDIAAHYPGTKIAITEYNYGGPDHISGGIAEADALGIFGREGVFAAAWWPLGDSAPYVDAALDVYLNYDGKGGRFGDTSVAATTSDAAAAAAAAHASVDSKNPGVMTVVLINRTAAPLPADVSIRSKHAFRTAEVYQLTGQSPAIGRGTDVRVEKPNTLTYEMPALSVTLLKLTGAE